GEFLNDRRVVEIPRLIWKPLLHGVILPFRSKRSAAKYASVWTPDGSPLKTWTAKQATLLRGWLGENGWDVEVAWAMRYGSPSVSSVLDDLQARGVNRVLVLPLYPQYSGATTASAFDAVFAWASQARDVPELRFVKHYHDHDAYIEALADRLRAHWDVHGRPDKLVLSFHGMPRRTLDRGDPYHCECRKTARLLAQRMNLPPDQWMVTFQSRFGRAEWLKPYTAPTLEMLAKQGVERVDVMCPGFVADCLETLEEIAMEAKETFLTAGGKTFHYVSCLNDRPSWIAALGGVCEAHGREWLDRREDRHRRAAEASVTREQAAKLNAPNLAPTTSA
ncbi:MAG TPA: ferrochelatase, partial [Burkholderiaceae bacterium]|nr:ferrochelatase [Burkholderiaceae bacterium]